VEQGLTVRLWARPGKVVSFALFTIAVALAAAGSAPVSGLTVGDYWVYAYHQVDPGVEWVGNLTQEYAGPLPGNLLGIRVTASGVLVGDVSGTWSLADINAYRSTDGAYVNSTSILTLQYVEFGDSYVVIDRTTTSNNPPVNLGGPLQVGAMTSGTTTETITRTVTVNGNSTGPTSQSSMVLLTETIIGRFQVSVPAGVFTAWQIRFTRSDTAPGYVEYAYNETVGNSVRIQVFDSAENLVASLELRDHRYQPGALGATPASTLLVFPYAVVGATAAVVVAIVWWDRRRRPGSVAGGPEASVGPPSPPPSRP